MNYDPCQNRTIHIFVCGEMWIDLNFEFFKQERVDCVNPTPDFRVFIKDEYREQGVLVLQWKFSKFSELTFSNLSFPDRIAIKQLEESAV